MQEAKKVTRNPKLKDFDDKTLAKYETQNAGSAPIELLKKYKPVSDRSAYDMFKKHRLVLQSQMVSVDDLASVCWFFANNYLVKHSIVHNSDSNAKFMALDRNKGKAQSEIEKIDITMMFTYIKQRCEKYVDGCYTRSKHTHKPFGYRVFQIIDEKALLKTDHSDALFTHRYKKEYKKAPLTIANPAKQPENKVFLYEGKPHVLIRYTCLEAPRTADITSEFFSHTQDSETKTIQSNSDRAESRLLALFDRASPKQKQRMLRRAESLARKMGRGKSTIASVRKAMRAVSKEL